MPSERPRVLILDDELDSLRSLAAALADRARVGTVPTVQALLAHVTRRDADVVVVHALLAQADGLAACDQVRRAWPEVGLVLASSKLLPDLVLAALGRGVDAFLRTPVDHEEAQAVIDHARTAAARRDRAARTRELETAIAGITDVTRDIGQALALLLTRLELLQESPDEASRRLAQRAAREGERLADLVRQLRSLSRPCAPGEPGGAVAAPPSPTTP